MFLIRLSYLIPMGTLMALSLPVTPCAAAEVVTLRSLDAKVRTQNPALAAARMMIHEALGLKKQSGRLQNPELEFQHSDQFGERSSSIGISQLFPITNRLHLEKQLGATQVRAAEMEVAEVENQLVGQAKATMVELLALRERKTLIRKQSALAREWVRFLKEATAQGERSSLEAGQMKLQASQYSTELHRLEAAEKRLHGQLKPLIGVSAGEALSISGDLPTLALPEGGDVEQRPALEAARLAVLQAEQQTEIQRAKRYGDVAAAVFLGSQRVVDAPNGADQEAILGMRLSIPLPWWNKNEGNIEAAEAQTERRLKEAVAMKQSIGVQAEAARAEMLEWASLVREIEQELLPQANQQVKESETAWRNGQTDLPSVLRFRDQQLQLATTRIDALKNFHLAHVTFQTATGTLQPALQK